MVDDFGTPPPRPRTPPEASPLKNGRGATTREARTEQLRSAEHLFEVDAATFESVFLKDSRLKKTTRTCLSVSRYKQLVKSLSVASESDSYRPTCDLLNAICDGYHSSEKVDPERKIRFIDHHLHPPCHHPHRYIDKYAHQKPDLLAVLKRIAELYENDVDEWEGNGKKGAKPAIAWHLIHSAVEGKGPDGGDPIYQAATYAGTLLQTRPDLTGTFDLAYDTKTVRIFCCDSSATYTTPPMAWDDKNTLSLLILYIHRLHSPLLVDPTVSLQPPPVTQQAAAANDWSQQEYAHPPAWVVRDSQTQYRIDKYISVGEPWTRLNLVGVSTRYGPVGGSMSDGPPVIVKDSFPDVRRLDLASEGVILDHVHRGGQHVRGVMRKISMYRVVDTSGRPVGSLVTGIAFKDTRIPPAERQKVRLILVGSAVASLPTCSSISEFLHAIYDASEVDKFLHEKRGVYHRDLSPFNIMLVVLEVACDDDDTDYSDEQPVFIKTLLSWRENEPMKKNRSTCLVIDLDNAKIQDVAVGAHRTGTPTFIARPLCRGTSPLRVFPAPMPTLSDDALNSYLAIHGQERYDIGSCMHDSRTFHAEKWSDKTVDYIRYDIESCYCQWVIVWFFMLALPLGADPKEDDTRPMTEAFKKLDKHEIMDKADDRDAIVVSGCRANYWQTVLHPQLRSFAPFLQQLSELMTPAYELWEPAISQYNLHEALQRLILTEVWRLKSEGDVQLDKHQRVLAVLPTKEGFSTTQPTNYHKRASDGVAGPNPLRTKRAKGLIGMELASAPPTENPATVLRPQSARIAAARATLELREEKSKEKKSGKKKKGGKK